MNESKPSSTSIPHWAKVASLTTVMALLWAASLFLVSKSSLEGKVISPGDLATLLFGASSVALFLLSIFLGIVALISWNTLENKLRLLAKEASEEATDALKNELRGRALAIMGYLIGEMSTDPKTLEVEVGNRDTLDEALTLLRDGYELLKKVGDGAAEYMALNNLVFYSCVYHDEASHGFLLEQARKLRRAGQEHNAPKLMLTACRVILQLGSDEKEKMEACRILRSLAGRSQISTKERYEAQLYLEKFCKLSEP